MTIIVENGTVVSGANSYVSTADLTTFATARGVTLVTDPEQLLISAMDYIESLSYKGFKWTYAQTLEWPRVDVYIDSWYNTATNIPFQLKNGLMQTAIAIDQGNSPQQDLQRSVIKKKVGEIEIDYAPSSAASIINTKIMSTLYKLLDTGSGSGQIRIGKA